jgi:hypothetical protein
MENGGAQDIICAPRQECLEDKLEPEPPEELEIGVQSAAGYTRERVAITL